MANDGMFLPSIQDNSTPTATSEAQPDSHHESDDSSSDSSTTAPTKRTRLKTFGRKTKSKTKRILHIDDTKTELKAEQDGYLSDLENNPAFNPPKVVEPSTLDKISGNLKVAGSAVIHPLHYVKSKTASTLATTDQPYFSAEADGDLLDAHAALGRAQSFMSGSSSDDEAKENDVQKWQKVIDDIEAKREMTKVAWTTGRFCHRVRVMAKPEVKFPEKSTFQEFDENGKLVRFQYEKWIGHLLLYITQDMGSRCIDDSTDLPFNRDVLVQNVERLIMASGPWQEWLLTLRSIYRWEDPKVTGRWFAVWALVWYLNCTISFTLCYVVFIVLQNRFTSQPIEKLRASHERAMDRGKSALKFGDLINRHGTGDWIDPLIDGVGPVAQVQLGDIADLLEILVNFYNWKYPRLTAYTIFFFCTCITVGLLTPADFSLKIVTMIIIWWFFLGRFVASYHPKYRHLVSPIKYVYWDIPTHAEWAFTYLRKTAQEARQKMIERKIQHQHDIETRHHPTYQGHVAPSPSPGIAGHSDDDDDDWHSAASSGGILDETDFLCFRCSHHDVAGQLAIYSDGIRFIRRFPKKELWRRSFSEIAEVNKLTGSRTVKLKKERLLEFTFVGGVVEKLEDVKRRDEAFNAVIGFSGLHWQQLQPRHDANVKT